MNRHQSPIDRRPFQPREALERQLSLEHQYRHVAIDEVVAALHHVRPSANREGAAKAA